MLLHATVKNRIFLPSLPAELGKQVEQQLTCINPVWASAARFGRRAPAGTVKYLRTFEHNEKGWFLPRGWQEEFTELAQLYGCKVSYEDKTPVFPKLITPKMPELWEYQIPWVDGLLKHRHGLGLMPPGGGKTNSALALYAVLGQPCLWLTHTKQLAQQTRERAQSILGIETGIIGGGKEDIKHFTVGIVQTLCQRDLSDIKVGLIVVDESQRAPSETFTTAVVGVNARYIYGLTATPYRGDGLETLMHQVLGPVRVALSRQQLRAYGKLMTPTVILRPTGFTHDYNSFSARAWPKLERAMLRDKRRNSIITTDVVVEATSGEHRCIVLVKQVEHGQLLYDAIKAIVPQTGLIYAELGDKTVRAEIEKFTKGDHLILIATYKMLAEGFDCPAADRIFLTAAVKDRTLIEQAIGRVERIHLGKQDALVFDYADTQVSVLREQMEERCAIYRANDDPITVRKA